MTYETALNWAIDHIDMNEYDDFNSWYDDVQDSLQTPSLDNPEFEKMAEDAWDREIGIEDEGEVIESPPSGVREIHMESGREEVTIDRSFTIGPSGIEPTESVKIELPKQEIKTEVKIDRTMSTSQKISFAQKIKSAFSSLGGLFRRKK